MGGIISNYNFLNLNGYREMPLDMYLNWLFEVRAKGDAFVNVKRQPKKFDTQKGNPYKNDTTMKIHMQTLTDGRYDEFPEFAETTYVGSAVYDVYKKRIIGFIKRDTLYSEATLEPEVVSRWLSTDPIFHPYESPYTAFANNPVYFIDPNGTTVGDYRNTSGVKIGTDGINDGKDYMVTDQTEASNIERLTENGMNVVQDYAKSSIELPSPYVRCEMQKSIEKTNEATTDRMGNFPNQFIDQDGGFHEESGVVGLMPDGHEVVSHDKPGQKCMTGTCIANSDNPLNPTLYKSMTRLYSYHTHPAMRGMYTKVEFDGTIGERSEIDMGYGFSGPTIPQDLRAIQDKVTSGKIQLNLSYVLDIRAERAFIYNSKGVLGSVSFEQFFKNNGK